MKQEVELYIGGKRVDLNNGETIAYNYKLTDLENPALVKNSFSKSVEVPNTPNNSDLFGHIWNVQRRQVYGGDGGAYFNAMIKTPFQLFINGNLVEKGYAKLESIRRNGEDIVYKIQLYGGIGQFIYSLGYDESSENNAKRTLNDLDYRGELISEPDLSFVINRDTIRAAWDTLQLKDYNRTWQTITFIPAYNGIPDDFDANKVLINNSGLNHNIIHNVYGGEGGVPYEPIYNGASNRNGFSLGETSEDLTEWEAFDLRSYLQRPAIKVSKVIEACCLPENNGGWEVALDNHFFNAYNPYYWQSYVTLPLLKDLDIKGAGETEEITGATASKVNTERWVINYGTSLSSLNSFRMDMSCHFVPNAGQSTTASTLYSYRNLTYNGGGITLQANTFVKNYVSSYGCVMQLLGRGEDGTIVAQSKAYLLSSSKYGADGTTPLWHNFWTEEDETSEPEYEWIQGCWHKVNGEYVFCDMTFAQKNITFEIGGSKNIVSLELKVLMNGSYKARFKISGSRSVSVGKYSFMEMYSSMSKQETGNVRFGPATMLDRTMGEVSFAVESFSGAATDYETLFSGTYIPRERLLSTSYSPADFLLSYCKTFGLYIYIDPTETSYDPVRCPNGVVHIMDRDTFYDETEMVDLEKMIDLSKDVTINPTTAGSKWYELQHKQIESDAENAYRSTYGYEYGRQLINVGYNFNSDTTELLKDSVFKGGIMATEKDKYFSKPTDGIPNYIYNGFKYYLYHSGDTLDMVVSAKTGSVGSAINNFGIQYYDAFPKCQFHSEDNSPEDGSGVLLFYNGVIETPEINYWLTDDVRDMVMLNGGNPCWIMTNNTTDAGGQQFAYPVSAIPFFTRDLMRGQTEGSIIHSWNFGHPKVTFSPEVYSTSGDCIYDKVWKNYLSDMYDVDSRVLTCNVLLPHFPSPSWMRKFYWYDGAIFRLNAIKDWKIGSDESTQCEFIRVQDIDNYSLMSIDMGGFHRLVMITKTVGASGGPATGKVYMQDGGWRFTDFFTGHDEDGNEYYINATAATPTHGEGPETTFVIDVPPTTATTPITWVVRAIDDYDSSEGLSDFFIQMPDREAFILIVKDDTGRIYAPAYGGLNTYQFDYDSLDLSTITITQMPSWVISASVNPRTRTFTLDIDTNDGTIYREGTITIVGTSYAGQLVQDSAILHQNAGTIEVYPTDMIFDYDEDWDDHREGIIITNDDWTITINDN